MKFKPLKLAILAGLLSASSAFAADQSTDVAVTPATAEVPVAEAEAPASNLSWNAAITSDYAYRGQSLSDGPAIQGGLDYAFGDSGFYASIFASNADFGDTDITGDGKDDGPTIEFDFFAGWNHDLSDDWNLDLSFARYSYFGEHNDYGSSDYNEYIGKITYAKMLDFSVAYANNYGNLGYQGFYYHLGGNWDIGHEFNLNAGFGYSDFSDGVPSFEDWNLGISRQFGPMNAALNYFDSNFDGVKGDAVVLTLSFGG